MCRQVLTQPSKKENLLRALMKACVHVNDSENILDLIQELKWVGYLTTPNQNRVWMKVYLHIINKPSMLFIKYGRFVILGILASLNRPEHSRLKFWSQFWTEVYMYAKKLQESKFSFLRYSRFIISDTLGMAGISWLHPIKSGVLYEG